MYLQYKATLENCYRLAVLPLVIPKTPKPVCALLGLSVCVTEKDDISENHFPFSINRLIKTV